MHELLSKNQKYILEVIFHNKPPRPPCHQHVIEEKPVVRPVGCWAAWEGGAGSVPGTACMAGLDPLLAQAL